MKKITKLTEADLSRIVKRVIKEDIQNNDLYLSIKDAMRNTNSGNDEKIQVLKYILRELEGDGWVTKDKVRKLWNMNEMDDELYTHSEEDISYDIKSMDCGDRRNDGHVDIDDDDTVVIRFCKGDEDKLDRLKIKGRKLLYSKYEM